MNSATKTDLERTAAPGSTRTGSRLYGIYLTALAASILGNLVLRMGMEGGWIGRGSGTASILGVFTALPLCVAAFLFWRLLRTDLDELVQRVLLEGLAFALIIYVPLTALYVNLRTAGVWVPRLDPPDLLMAPALLTALGVGLAWRRYR